MRSVPGGDRDWVEPTGARLRMSNNMGAMRGEAGSGVARRLWLSLPFAMVGVRGRRGASWDRMRSGKRQSLLAVALGSAALLLSTATTSAQGPTIEATGDGYGGFIWSPSTADVSAGGAVTFKSGSPTVPHGVTWTGGPESPSCSGVPIDEGKTSWSGSCAFAQAGTYAFVCTVHPSEMKGAITVRSGGAGTTNPAPPPAPPAQSSPSGAVARGLKLARAQRGRSVRGSIVVSRPGSSARLKIDLLARRARLFGAKRKGRVRVGRLVRSGLQAGRVSFTVHLKRFARRALRRHRRLQRLPLTVRVVVTSPQRDAVKLTRRVVLRV
jgi:plastocyanin